ncbi:hypothetical protein TNCV_1922741 [Trichonephila clavipes]|nr:hypothetical protein TNCV_1922741 [Trichonephila clavipes]
MLTPNTHSIGRLGSPSLPSSTPLVPASETPPTSINQVATQGQRQHQTEDGGIRKLIPVPCSKTASSSATVFQQICSAHLNFINLFLILLLMSPH